MPETTSCHTCGTELTLPPSRINDRNFCDRECYAEYNQGETHSSYTGGKIETECDQCGDPITRVRANYEEHDNHFCGHDCQVEWQRGPQPETPHDCPSCSESFPTKHGVKIHHYHKHDESIADEATVTKDCQNCGEPFEFRESQLDHRTPRFCSHECFYDYGNGGVGVERIRRIFTPHARCWNDVADDYREDHDVCEICGNEPEGRGLDVHHIVPIRYGGTHFNANLVAVCRSCHSKAEMFAEDLFDHHVWREDGGRCLTETPPPVMANTK